MGGNSGQVILLPSFYTPSKHRLSERVERTRWTFGGA